MSVRSSLGERRFLEVIGPNLTFEGELEGIGARAAALPGPRLLLWVVGVRDFGAHLRDAARAGYPLSDMNHVLDGCHGYRVGAMGAQAAPRIPSAVGREAHDGGKKLATTSGCRIVDFTVHHPEPEKVQKAYDALGTTMLVRRGEEPRLRLLPEKPRADDVILSWPVRQTGDVEGKVGKAMPGRKRTGRGR